jgi:hypothetical protein
MNIKISAKSLILGLLLVLAFSILLNLDIVRQGVIKDIIGTLIPYTFPAIFLTYIFVKMNHVGRNNLLGAALMALISTIISLFFLAIISLVVFVITMINYKISFDTYFKVNQNGYSSFGNMLLMTAVIIVVNVVATTFIAISTARKNKAVEVKKEEVKVATQPESTPIQPVEAQKA